MFKYNSTLFLFTLLSFNLFAQPGSVELKDGSGSLISSHASITEAYTAITAPITKAYIIELAVSYNGSSETFPITLGAKSGASNDNTIILRPAAGNTGEQILGSPSNNSTLVLSDADYVIIDGRPGGVGSTPDLIIQNNNTSGTNSKTIWLKDGATNNIVRYINVVNKTQNTAGPRAIEIGTSASVGNSNNIITHCNINGGRSGVGIAGATTFPNDNNTISNCEIYDWGYAGIWLVSGALNTNIDSNKIYQTVGVNNTIVSGIIMATMAGGNYNIRKNWIYDLQSTSTSTSTVIRGIYSAAPAAGSTFNVENNMISNSLDNLNVQTVTGIEFLGSNAYNANIYFNSINVGGNHVGGTTGATTSAAIRIGSSTTQNLNLNMKNNLAINKRTGGNVTHIGFFLFGTTGTVNLDYNCYYADGRNSSFHAFIGTTGYNVLSAYKTAQSPNEQNTVFKDVSFNSLTNLHLTGSSVQDPYLAGTPITGITTDFDGESRNLTLPYKGADETTAFTVYSLNLSALVEGFYTPSLEAMVPDTVTVELRTNTSPWDLIEKSRVLLDGTGSGMLSYLFPQNAINYYIALKHRNSIETWSKTAVAFSSGSLNYDFTTAATQAFGDNMKQKGTKWCIYNGDVNQDGLVDLSDVSLTDTDNLNFVTGYTVTDVNGDNLVDLSDLSIVDVNNLNFVSKVVP